MGTTVRYEPSDEELLFKANTFVTGEISSELEKNVTRQLRGLRESGEDAIIEITTKGGDADAGRRIANEISAFIKFGGHAFIIGRTAVYSAGMTIMAAVPPQNRFLTNDTMLLIHERHMRRTIELTGPLSSSLQIIREELATLEASIKLETAGFAEIIRGTPISLEALREKARTDWYISASQALGLGLVARIINCT